MTPITVDLPSDQIVRLQRVADLINIDQDVQLSFSAMTRVAVAYGLPILEQRTNNLLPIEGTKL